MQRNESPAQPHPSIPRKAVPPLPPARTRKSARPPASDDLLELSPFTDEPTSTWLHLSWGIELG